MATIAESPAVRYSKRADRVGEDLTAAGCRDHQKVGAVEAARPLQVAHGELSSLFGVLRRDCSREDPDRLDRLGAGERSDVLHRRSAGSEGPSLPSQALPRHQRSGPAGAQPGRRLLYSVLRGVVPDGERRSATHTRPSRRTPLMKSQAPKVTTIMLSARAGRGPIHRPSNAVTRRYMARSPRPAAMTSTKTSAAVRGRSTNEGPWLGRPITSRSCPCHPCPSATHTTRAIGAMSANARHAFRRGSLDLTVGELAPHPCAGDSQAVSDRCADASNHPLEQRCPRQQRRRERQARKQQCGARTRQRVRQPPTPPLGCGRGFIPLKRELAWRHDIGRGRHPRPQVAPSFAYSHSTRPICRRGNPVRVIADRRLRAAIEARFTHPRPGGTRDGPKASEIGQPAVDPVGRSAVHDGRWDHSAAPAAGVVHGSGCRIPDHP